MSNIKNSGLLFHYNITTDPVFVIGYVFVRRILCGCSAGFKKLDYQWNIIEDKNNQDQYKGANQNVFICLF